MSKHEEHTEDKDPVDLKLAREIRHLDKEIQPERNLWPGIEQRIADYPQRKTRRIEKLIPYGLAASLVLALAALMVSLTNTPSSGPIPTASLETLQAEYMRVRNPILEQFNETNRGLDPQSLSDLYRNIKIMEDARHEIEILIKQNPDNRHLVGMLMKVHRQELELLRQDYTRAQQSL